jgi:cell division protein FtsB
MSLKKNQLYSKPALLLLAVMIVFLAKGTWGVYQKEHESRKNVARVQTELESLKLRKESLEAETKRLATDEGVEAALREKYQVSKEGESVLVVVDKPLPPSANEEDRNFFSKVWKSMSGIFKNDGEVKEEE